MPPLRYLPHNKWKVPRLHPANPPPVADLSRQAWLHFGMRDAPAPIEIAAAAVALASLIPIVFIGWITWDVGWETVRALIFRPRVGELLGNTALLELVTVPASIVVAVTLAWLTERTDLPYRRLWAWLAIAPLAIPAFVHSYAWISLFPSLRGLGGGTLISVIAYFPFLYLPVSAALRRLDPAIEDAAASLGLDPWRVFFRVVLPQLRLAICSGSLLIGLHLLSEYGLYEMIRFDTFATAIFDQFQSAYNSPAANMLAGVLIIACAALIGLELLLRGGERYARVGTGSPRPTIPRQLGRYRMPALILCGGVAILSLGVPLATLGRWIIIGGSAIWTTPEVASASIQTVLLGLAGGIVATTVALPSAWSSVRLPGRLQRMIEACHYYAGALPGIVVALALVTLTVRYATPLYQTSAMLIVAYVLLFLPRAMVGLRASLAQAPVELERAAMALGRTPLNAITTVTLRLAAPGAAASIALVALGIANELTATLMLAPNGVETLATRFWSLTSEIDYVGAAPYAAMMVVLSLPLTILLHIQSQRSQGQ
jgi:iron(III) transport system permease protein